MTTFDQQLRDYRAQGYNLLLPIHHLHLASALRARTRSSATVP